MPRRDYITRKVKGTTAHVLQVNVKEKTITEADYFIRFTFKEDVNLLKALKRMYDNSQRTIIKIVDKHYTEQMYGMEIADFVAHAIPLGANRKPLTDSKSIESEKED